MFLVAHPDDELLFLGGAIPTYATEQQRKVVVAYMTYSNTTRRSELLNGLWEMGVRNYPVIGDFWDNFTSTAEEAAENWGERECACLRGADDTAIQAQGVGHARFQRRVRARRARADCASSRRKPTRRRRTLKSLPRSAQAYGTWQVQKLYSHLYEQNQIKLDWSMPLTNLGGKTGLEAAAGAYALHLTQESTKFSDGGNGNQVR